MGEPAAGWLPHPSRRAQIGERDTRSGRTGQGLTHMRSLGRTTRRAGSILLALALALGFLAHEAVGDDAVDHPVRVGTVSRFPSVISY
jgi:hypothetical protein